MFHSILTFNYSSFLFLVKCLFYFQLGILDVFEPRTADLSPMTPDLGVYARDVQQSIGVNIRNYMKPDRTHSRESFYRPTDPPLIVPLRRDYYRYYHHPGFCSLLSTFFLHFPCYHSLLQFQYSTIYEDLIESFWFFFSSSHEFLVRKKKKKGEDITDYRGGREWSAIGRSFDQAIDMTQSVKLRFSGVRGPRTMRYRCMLLRTTKGIPNSFAHCVTVSIKSLESCLKSWHFLIILLIIIFLRNYKYYWRRFIKLRIIYINLIFLIFLYFKAIVLELFLSSLYNLF